jgi:hypothetical protein
MAKGQINWCRNIYIPNIGYITAGNWSSWYPY